MGLPVGFFNPIFALGSVSPVDLGAALAVVRDRQLPFVVHIRERASEGSVSVADELGLKQTTVLPGMALPLPAAAPADPPGLRVQRVVDEPSYSAGLVVAAEGFGMPLPFAEMAFPRSMFDDDGIRGCPDAGTPGKADGCYMTTGSVLPGLDDENPAID